VTKQEIFITFMFWDVCFKRTFLPPIINAHKSRVKYSIKKGRFVVIEKSSNKVHGF